MTFNSITELYEHLYTNGGGFKPYIPSIIGRGRRFLEKAEIVKSIENAIKLRNAFDSFLRDKHNFEHAHAIWSTLSDNYDVIVDDVLINASFECYAKAMLLKQQYVIHKIDWTTSKPPIKQSKNPIHFKTFRRYKKEGYIRGIKELTLSANDLLSPKYYRKLNIPLKHKKQFDNIRLKRNQIHAVDFATTWGMDKNWLSAIKWLKDEYNKLK